ncbi:MAG: hypothetical protein LBI94_04740 [Treponema sp.]|jgi:hypothetical protein|nr:hypothetical protein [Treponema sp.]
MKPKISHRIMPKAGNIPLMKVPDNLIQVIGERMRLDRSRSEFFIRDLVLGWEINGLFEKKIVKHIGGKRLKAYNALKQELAAEEDGDKLFERLFVEKNIETRSCIQKRLIELDDKIYSRFLAKLKDAYSEECYDTVFIALGIIINKIDISDGIIRLLKGNSIRNPADFSALVQLLGYRKNETNLRYLYTYYNFFVNNFEDEDYYEGPVIGIRNFYDAVNGL